MASTTAYNLWITAEAAIGRSVVYHTEQSRL